jgi:hypothetical protein
MTNSTHLSFDTDALGQMYVPFEPAPAPANGWNYDGGQSAYFVSQGSEYKLALPDWEVVVEAPSADQASSIDALITALVEAIGTKPDYQQTAADLTAWAQGIVGGGTAELMTVHTTATHIRNTAPPGTSAFEALAALGDIRCFFRDIPLCKDRAGCRMP